MTDGDFWYATATRMLGPLLFAAAFGGGDMDDVIRWVDTQEQDEVLDLLEATGVEPALHVARSVFGKEERQRSSIYTTVETILEPFAGLASSAAIVSGTSTSTGSAPPAAHPLAGGEIDPAALLHGTNTLYLCAPAHDQRRLMPLFVSVIRQTVEYAYDHVSRSRRPLEPPLLIVLDEAANIAPLSDLDSLAATAAGHGIQLVTVWHDMAQIQARYGPAIHHCGEQSPRQTISVRNLRPLDARLCQSSHRRRGGRTSVRNAWGSGFERRAKHNSFTVGPPVGSARCSAANPSGRGGTSVRRPTTGAICDFKRSIEMNERKRS